MDATQRYRVKAADGSEHVGYVTLQQMVGSPPVLWLYDRVYRLLHATGTNAPYQTPPARSAWSYYHDLHQITIVSPQWWRPEGAPVPEQQVPYAAKHNGTWWRDIKVPYTEIQLSDAERRTWD